MVHRRRRSEHASTRRRFDDSGVALLEMALVTPAFLLIIFGILEFGFAFRSYLAVGDTVSEAARVGALQGPSNTTLGQTADQSIVKAVREGTASLELDAIEAIVIFEGRDSSAGSPLNQVPSACKRASSSIPGTCNVYPAHEAFYAAQQDNKAYFTCDGANPRPCGWSPSSRSNGPAVRQIDYLGVYIRYKHPFMTGVFGKDITLESAAVLRLEPGAVE